MALVVRIRGDSTHFEKTMARVQGSVGGVAKGMLRLTAQTAAFGAALLGIGGGLAVVSKFVELMKDSSGKAATLEELTLQFETLTGSATKAADLIAKFREEATKSPLNTTDYANAGKTLLSMGVSAGDLMPKLRMLGDVSMGNAERFASLALAFGQTTAAGRLMGGEVQQFIATGFNPLMQISRKTGVSMADLKKKMEDGAVSSDMVTQAFKDATSAGGLFYKAIEKGAESFNGKMAKAVDSVDSLKIAFGTGLNEGFAAGLDKISETLPKFEEFFASLGGKAGETITTAIGEAFAGRGEVFFAVGESLGELLMDGMSATIGGGVVNKALRPMLEWLEGSNMGTPEAIAKAKERVDSYLGPERSTFGNMSEAIDRSKERITNAFDGARQRQFDEAREKRHGEMRSDRDRTEELLKRYSAEQKKTRETLEKIYDELRKDKPMFKR